MREINVSMVVLVPCARRTEQSLWVVRLVIVLIRFHVAAHWSKRGNSNKSTFS